MLPTIEPIEPSTIPSKTYDKYWVVNVNINAPNAGGDATASVFLRKFGVFDGVAEFMPNELGTNIIIDNALEREPFWNASEQVLSLIEKGTIAGYISASTFSDLYYIIRKARGRDWTLT